ncbi:MBL fold metallo-hydrolase [Roseiflexus castenholzii]|jgi:glyoxylase-like metal-dependent hydrolase (beta-lactamase superfamily II)|uniref:MBL fold metallo-hydrolase n=1 Tax=Roseiflexus castenholzii TaxID=120962 RepID=UPI003C7BE059
MTDPRYGLPETIALIDDLHLGCSQVVGTYVMLGDDPVIVDPGPASVLPNLEAGLKQIGLSFSDLHGIVLSHIHLDHAGATGSLVRYFPHLKVYVHHRGAPHMIAPDKLLRSATRIYGGQMDYLWGEFLPVPVDNIVTLGGGETLRIGGRALRVFDAPGHAAHHLIYFDESTGAAFVGDTTGLRMPGHTYVRPATPPPDIDLEAWRRTLDMLLSLNPRMLLLTHFGPAHDPERHIADMWDHVLRWAETVRVSLERGEEESAAEARLVALADADLGDVDEAMRRQYAQAGAVEMSWHGLARYWRKRMEAS